MLGFLFLAFILLFLSHLSLRERVVTLEKKRDASHTVSAAGDQQLSPLPPPEAEKSFVIDVAQRRTPTFSVEADSDQEATRLFEREVVNRSVFRWFRNHTLISVGTILLFLGAAWFVTYAVRESLISPGIQIVIGFITAGIAYTVAYNRSDVSSLYYGVLTALGTSILGVTALAGAIPFSLYPPLVALLIVGSSVAYSVFVATRIEAEWLAVLAVSFGLITPLFINMGDTPLLLLLYLLILTSGLLVSGQRRAWCVVPLVLILGVSWFEAHLLGAASQLLGWVFVMTFSLLFFITVTAAFLKGNTLNRLGVTTLIITSVLYVTFASLLAKSPALATFGATLVVIIALYTLYKERVSAQIISVYLTLAVMGILVGTSFLFSGGALVFALAAECAGAFLLATYLGLPERFVLFVSAMYVLPVTLSIPLFLSLVQDSNPFTSETFATYTVLVLLWSSALWLIHKPGVALYQSSRILSTVFAVSGFFYAYIVSATIMNSLFLESAGYVMTYVSWSVISLATLFYVMKNNFPSKAMRAAALSFLLPLCLSLASLAHLEWQSGVHHVSAFGVWSMVGVLCLVILLITQQYCAEFDLTLRKVNGFFIFITTLFTFAVLRVTIDSLFSAELADVITYVSYAAVLYSLVSVFILARSPQFWIRVAVLSFLFPLVLSLRSFTSSGWPQETFMVQVAGLSAIGIFSLLLSLGISKRLYLVAEKEARDFLGRMSRVFWFTTVCIGSGVVWGVTHSLLVPVQAVSLSLFIYTISGLSAYILGTRKRNEMIRYAGVVLLTIVIGRLVIADIWYMEILWRFVTLCGIGTLFVVAALIERSIETKELNVQ